MTSGIELATSESNALTARLPTAEHDLDWCTVSLLWYNKEGQGPNHSGISSLYEMQQSIHQWAGSISTRKSSLEVAPTTLTQRTQLTIFVMTQRASIAEKVNVFRPVTVDIGV